MSIEEFKRAFAVHRDSEALLREQASLNQQRLAWSLKPESFERTLFLGELDRRIGLLDVEYENAEKAREIRKKVSSIADDLDRIDRSRWVDHSGLKARALDPAKVRQAVQRPDLGTILRQNDLYGDFPDPFDLYTLEERHQKVLWNTLEAAIQADEAEQAWRTYEAKVLSGGDRKRRVVDVPVRVESDYDRERTVVVTAREERVYKLAILGAGASAAYVITNRSLDLGSTLIVGEKDPWGGERGGDEDAVVNHPHWMIDPDPELSPEEQGLALRKEFAARVAKVLDTVPNQCGERIEKVFREKVDGEAYFAIQTSSKVFLAKEVVSALGIGPHQKALTATWDRGDEVVRDMDTFMRGLPERGELPDTHTVGVSGGNAAIDVVTAVLRSGKAHVHWFTGSRGPSFLDGTDNDIAKAAYNKGAGGPRVTVHPYRCTAVEQDGPRVKMLGTKETEFAVVHEVVFGVGPDTGVIDALFDPSCFTAGPTDEVETPVLDRDSHFRVGLVQRDPDAIVSGLALSRERSEELARLLKDPDLSNEPLVGVVAPKELEKGPQRPVGSVERVGGHETRQPGKGTSDYISSVNATLPPNVIMGDQLTSARARIQATENAMPPRVDVPGGVDLVTANQTVLAVHLATCWPKLPVAVRNYLVAQIVVSRNKEPLPLPKRLREDAPHSIEPLRAFQKGWLDRISELDRLTTK